jgi:tRNA U34 5-carboxymethylaminomethyl modifying GTPase MnmE/TrmE
MFAPAIRALSRIELRLARPLRIAIIGEFNSGKSSLANLLARIESLPTAVVSSTRIPTLLYHAQEPQICALHPDGRREWLRNNRATEGQTYFRVEVGLPSPQLRAVQLLDLPGLANPRFDCSLEDLSLHGVDAVLWCTLSTQAWKESERAAWDRLPLRLRRRGLLVITHSDALADPSDREKLLDRVRRDAGSFRDIVMVSTNKALALLEGPAGSAETAWKASGADQLEAALAELLESVSGHRREAALDVTARIARATLARLEPASAG